jgi:integrase/recombinase XerD
MADEIVALAGEIVPTEGLKLDQHPAAVYLASLRPNGRRAMHYALNTVADLLRPGSNAFTLEWHTLRYQHTAAVRAKLGEKFKPATANLMLTAMRRVLLECKRLGLMSGDDYATAIDIKAIKGQSIPKGRALQNKELATLIKLCQDENTPSGVRDAALIAVLYGAGLRRGEAVTLKLANYDPAESSLTIRGGKGGKDRITYIEEGASNALSGWLKLRGDKEGALFCPVNKGGNLTIRQMTDQSVYEMLTKRRKQAGLNPFSPHDLRRTFISDLLDAGADVSTVQKLAGHAQVTTTVRYDRRGEEAKKKAVKLLKVPFNQS